MRLLDQGGIEMEGGAEALEVSAGSQDPEFLSPDSEEPLPANREELLGVSGYTRRSLTALGTELFQFDGADIPSTPRRHEPMWQEDGRPRPKNPRRKWRPLIDISRRVHYLSGEERKSQLSSSLEPWIEVIATKFLQGDYRTAWDIIRKVKNTLHHNILDELFDSMKAAEGFREMPLERINIFLEILEGVLEKNGITLKKPTDDVEDPYQEIRLTKRGENEGEEEIGKILLLRKQRVANIGSSEERAALTELKMRKRESRTQIARIAQENGTQPELVARKFSKRYARAVTRLKERHNGRNTRYRYLDPDVGIFVFCQDSHREEIEAALGKTEKGLEGRGKNGKDPSRKKEAGSIRQPYGRLPTPSS